MTHPTTLIFMIAVIALALQACSSSKVKPDHKETETSTNNTPESQPATPHASNTDALFAKINAAVATDTRPKADRDRDTARKPAEVLNFFGITPGMKVADIMGGGGYYTEILANLVGPQGHVYILNNKLVVSKFADKPLTERLTRLEANHITRLDKELEEVSLPQDTLDAALMILFYHDTYWLKTNRMVMNKNIFAALKPGGIYGIIDHHAAKNTKDRDVKTLHRIDADLVQQEILAAGFELVSKSDLLSHSGDNHTINVFDAAIRGKTDRFIFKFRKPFAK